MYNIHFPSQDANSTYQEVKFENFPSPTTTIEKKEMNVVKSEKKSRSRKK